MNVEKNNKRLYKHSGEPKILWGKKNGKDNMYDWVIKEKKEEENKK